MKIRKISSNSSISDNNNCYSLAGAEYGVYSDAGCTNLIGTLVTGDDGNSLELEVDAARCYIKEIKAPKGFSYKYSGLRGRCRSKTKPKM